ncbi:MAG: hypothetical protein ACOZNI_09460 [Myxococcota bacterium]
MRALPPVVVYLAVAVALTWPAAVAPIEAVPGGDRTDLWDSLWSLWYFCERVYAGEVPLRVDGLLNHPSGGTLWVADPVNAVLALPLLWAIGPAATWTVLVLAHVTFAGVAAHRLGEAVGGSGWVAGVGYAAAPLLMAHVHNGASEAVGTGWLAWAVLELWRLREGGSVVRAGVALGVCAVAHWYAGVVRFLFLAALLVRGPGRRLAAAGALACAIALPVAALAHSAATDEGNVVGIKNERELRIVRRTIGGADPVGFVAPRPYRSPDFPELSRYGEEYWHCAYLGWVGIVFAAASLRGRREGTAPIWLGGGAALVLACGPVLQQFGEPVILPGRLAIPLPYFLLEKLPGFASLSLVWRLSQGAVLAVAVLAARGAPSRLAPAVAVAMLMETRFVAPMGLPETTDARIPAPVDALAAAEPGAVMLFPVVGGRAYLYEQTRHGKPLCASLNFPNNAASKKVWTAILAHRDEAPAALRSEVSQRARAVGIRYLLAHDDPGARRDMHDQAMLAVRRTWTPVAEGDGVQVFQLW